MKRWCSQIRNYLPKSLLRKWTPKLWTNALHVCQTYNVHIPTIKLFQTWRRLEYWLHCHSRSQEEKEVFANLRTRIIEELTNRKGQKWHGCKDCIWYIESQCLLPSSCPFQGGEKYENRVQRQSCCSLL